MATSKLPQFFSSTSDHRGDVDWHTLGNILSAYILGEVSHTNIIARRRGRQGEEDREREGGDLFDCWSCSTYYIE